MRNYRITGQTFNYVISASSRQQAMLAANKRENKFTTTLTKEPAEINAAELIREYWAWRKKCGTHPAGRKKTNSKMLHFAISGDTARKISELENPSKILREIIEDYFK